MESNGPLQLPHDARRHIQILEVNSELAVVFIKVTLGFMLATCSEENVSGDRNALKSASPVWVERRPGVNRQRVRMAQAGAAGVVCAAIICREHPRRAPRWRASWTDQGVQEDPLWCSRCGQTVAGRQGPLLVSVGPGEAPAPGAGFRRPAPVVSAAPGARRGCCWGVGPRGLPLARRRGGAARDRRSGRQAAEGSLSETRSRT